MSEEKMFPFAGDPLWRRDQDPGYRVGWRHKVRFEKGPPGGRDGHAGGKPRDSGAPGQGYGGQGLLPRADPAP